MSYRISLLTTFFLFTGLTYSAQKTPDKNMSSSSPRQSDELYRERVNLEREALRIARESKKENTVVFSPIKPTKRFSNLLGSIPHEITDIIDEVKNNSVKNVPILTYKLILYGPPGTGKTALAEAIAGELGWDFYNVLAGDLLTKYQGSGNQKITQLFDTIVASGNKAVLFIDEIDGLAHEEHADKSSELKRAVQALHKIDNIKENLICILATNDKEKLPATIKSRFSEDQICIVLPDNKKKFLILKDLLKSYDISDADLRKAIKFTHGFDCREIQTVARKAIRITSHFSQNESEKEKTTLEKMAVEYLLLAIYMVQKASKPSADKIKSIFRYFVKRHCKELDENTINQLFDRSNSGYEMEGLTVEQIKLAIQNAISLAHDANKTTIDKDDLFVGIYYNFPDKLPNIGQRVRILNYFLRSLNLNINPEDILRVAEDAADNFTGEELEQIVQAAASFKDENETQNRADADLRVATVNLNLAVDNLNGANETLSLENYLYLALHYALQNKAKPFCVIQSISYEYAPWGNFGVSAGIGKDGSGNAGLNGSTTLPKTKTSYSNFCIEKSLLESEGKYLPIKSFGKEIEKISRLEYYNEKMPSLSLALKVIEHYLNMEKFDVVESMRTIMSSEIFRKILLIAQISTSTLKEIIRETCNNTRNRHAMGTICNEDDLKEALNSLRFQIDHYKAISLPENGFCKSYRGLTAQRSTCVVS